MPNMRWEEARARKNEFTGGQLAYSHLGDSYRGEVADVVVPGSHDCAYIQLKWTAIWYSGKWHKHEEERTVEAILARVLEQQKDGGYLFPSFVMSDTTLYPKGHPSNIKLEDVEPELTA